MECFHRNVILTLLKKFLTAAVFTFTLEHIFTLLTGIENFLSTCGEMIVILCRRNSGQSRELPEKNPKEKRQVHMVIKTDTALENQRTTIK